MANNIKNAIRADIPDPVADAQFQLGEVLAALLDIEH